MISSVSLIKTILLTYLLTYFVHHVLVYQYARPSTYSLVPEPTFSHGKRLHS